jgi:hypothetical protein
MIRQRNLPESTLPAAGGPGAGAFLYCPRCGGEWSATRADYWALDPDAPMLCRDGHRSTMLRLVKRVCQLVEVSA